MLKFNLSGKDRKMVVRFVSLYVVNDDHAQLLATLVKPGLKGKAVCVFDFDEGVLTTTLVNQDNWKSFPVLTDTELRDCLPFDDLKHMLRSIKQLVVKELKMAVDYSQLTWCAGVEETFSGCEPWLL